MSVKSLAAVHTTGGNER